MTFGDGLTFQEAAKFNFSLIANSSADRGTNYSGVNVTDGVLTVDSGAIFNMDFSVGGVDFTDEFWSANQSWLIFDNALAPNLAGDIFTLGTLSTDSLGQSFDITGGMFSFEQSGNDILLLYTIPEARTTALLLGVVAAFVVLRIRRLKSKQFKRL